MKTINLSIYLEQIWLEFFTQWAKPFILNDQPQIFYFLRLVKEPSMNRKLFSSVPKEISKNKRTTIYLTSELSLKKPTREINSALENLSSIIKIISNNFPLFQKRKLSHKTMRKSYQRTLSVKQLYSEYYRLTSG